MGILKRINRTDWILIGLYNAIILPMMVIGEWAEETWAFFSMETLSLTLTYIADYALDMVVAILVVFWVFTKFFRQKKYFLTFLITLFLLAFQRFVQSVFIPWKYPWYLDEFLPETIWGIQNNFQAISGVVLLLIGKKYYESKNEVMQLEKEKKESELQLLRAQIDPHFLFNNLNILDILIKLDPDKASRYTKRLSSLYRYMIRHKDQDVVSLKEEWEFSEDYIFLLQQRFDNLFLFVNELAGKELESYFIPPASMQTLLENIVKHNFALPDEPIHAIVYLENDFLCVKNDRRLKEAVKDSTGTGLNNLKKRIQLLTDQTLIIEQTSDTFLVKVPLVKLV